MLLPGDSVSAALSGGADSVCLLHLLRELGVLRRAIHINHGIRGDEAARDEAFCVDLCKSLGIPLDVFHVDVPARARETGMGLEEAGRSCRYDIFDSYGTGDITGKIATAHTRSDNTETILLGLSRGCGLSGLTGIPPVRGRIIRPLIDITRDEVEAYCAARSLSYVNDSTNRDTGFSRNKIRLEVIPRLEELNPNIHQAAAKLSEILRDEDNYLCELADNAAGIANLWELPIALRRRVIRRMIVSQTGLTPEFFHVEKVCDMLAAQSGTVQLKGGWRAEITGDSLRVVKIAPKETPASWEVLLDVNFARFVGVGPSHPCDGRSCGRDNPAPTEIAPTEITLPDGRNLSVNVLPIAEFHKMSKFNTFLLKESLDYDKIRGNVSENQSMPCVRNRREGDRFAPAGRGVTKKLRKLLCETKIPQDKRDSLCLLAIKDSSGILWAEGFGAAEGFQVTGETRRAMVIHPA